MEDKWFKWIKLGKGSIEIILGYGRGIREACIRLREGFVIMTWMCSDK